MPYIQTAARSDLFVFAKTSSGIPARHPLIRDALVQASLDPQVRALEFVPSAIVETTRVALKAIIFVRDDRRFYLDVVDARPVDKFEVKSLALIALDQLSLSPLVLTAADIKREPLFANATTVWAYRRHPVRIEMRMQILSVLQEDGPLQVGYLLQRVRAIQDPAVMALACSDLVELDLISQPLGPTTIVRSRS
jgi:hypothetical protein